MKKNCFLLFWVVIALATNMNAQISDALIDDAGDIIITAYHNNPDAFSFVFLDDCPNTTTIRFIDEEWTGSSFHANNGEGELLWTNNTGITIPKGTVIHITNADDNGTGIHATHGIVSETASFNTSAGDEIIAITGTRENPGTFLTFFGDTNGSSLNGTGLGNGHNALYDNLLGMGYYAGPAHCDGLSITDCAKQLTHINHWNLTNDFSIPETPFNTINLSKTLGIRSEGIAGFTYGPNPVINTLEIQAQNSIDRIEIFNISGTKMQAYEVFQSQVSIGLENLNSGIYLAKAHSEQRAIHFLFIKK